jgi:hypothetical protein
MRKFEGPRVAGLFRDLHSEIPATFVSLILRYYLDHPTENYGRLAHCLTFEYHINRGFTSEFYRDIAELRAGVI